MLFRDTVEIALEEIREELSATSQATWASHAKKHLAYWGSEREVLTITKREIQTWINLRAKEVKSSTIGHELCFLSRLWKIHEDRDLDTGYTCPLLRLKKPKKKTDKRKIDAEVVVALSQKLAPGDWDLVYFTLLTLLRRLEVFRLKPEHIIRDFDNEGNVRWKAFVVTSKTGKSRFVALNQVATEIVMRKIDECKEKNSIYLFGDQREDRFRAAVSWSKRVWLPLMKSAGVTGHFHGLRHRGAHNAWRAGAPIESISRLLGHSNLVQTQHYLGITDEAMWEAAYATNRQPSPQQKEDKLTDSVISEELGTCVVKQQQSASDWIFSM